MIIEGTKFGSITVNGKIYPYDIYVLPNNIIEKRNKKNSPRIDGHRSLGKSEVEFLLSFNPEMIFIGKGQSGILPFQPEAREILSKSKITVIEDLTPRLLTQFNQMYTKNKNIVAVFHTTC